jgi:hypothetical protein
MADYAPAAEGKSALAGEINQVLWDLGATRRKSKDRPLRADGEYTSRHKCGPFRSRANKVVCSACIVKVARMVMKFGIWTWPSGRP